MKYFLKADTKEELLNDLRNAGFEWYDYSETGERTPRDPKKREVATLRGIGSCIYLEHLVEVPAVYDGEELVTPAVLTTTFHANCLMRNEHTFATDMGIPGTPQYDWA